jgi:hypothetical protein
VAIIITHSALAAMLVPLLIALFFFSTPKTRHGHIFITIVFAILLSIATTTISLYYAVRIS